MCLCYSIFSVFSSFAIISLTKESWLFSFVVFFVAWAVIFLCHLLIVPWVGLQYVIVVIPGHTHSLFNNISSIENSKAQHNIISIKATHSMLTAKRQVNKTRECKFHRKYAKQLGNK